MNLLWEVSILPVPVSRTQSLCCFNQETHWERFSLCGWFVDVHHQNFTDDDGSQVYLEFLPLPTDRLSSTTSMALNWLQATHGFAIVFCIRQRESFDKLVDDFKFFLQLKEKNNVPLILVGSEPGYCESGSENARQVTAEGMAPYLCSLLHFHFLASPLFAVSCPYSKC